MRGMNRERRASTSRPRTSIRVPDSLPDRSRSEKGGQGKLGPLAQSCNKFQVNRRFWRVLEKSKTKPAAELGLTQNPGIALRFIPGPLVCLLSFFSRTLGSVYRNYNEETNANCFCKDLVSTRSISGLPSERSSFLGRKEDVLDSMQGCRKRFCNHYKRLQRIKKAAKIGEKDSSYLEKTESLR